MNFIDYCNHLIKFYKQNTDECYENEWLFSLIPDHILKNIFTFNPKQPTIFLVCKRWNRVYWDVYLKNLDKRLRMDLISNFNQDDTYDKVILQLDSYYFRLDRNILAIESSVFSNLFSNEMWKNSLRKNFKLDYKYGIINEDVLQCFVKWLEMKNVEKIKIEDSDLHSLYFISDYFNIHILKNQIEKYAEIEKDDIGNIDELCDVFVSFYIINKKTMIKFLENNCLYLEMDDFYYSIMEFIATINNYHEYFHIYNLSSVPHLLDIFDKDENIVTNFLDTNITLKDNHYLNDYNYIVSHFGDNQVNSVLVDDIDKFKERFNEFSFGVLNDKNWSWNGIAVCGGSVYMCLDPNIQQKGFPVSSDVDLFIFGATEENRRKTLKKTLQYFSDKFKDNVFFALEASVIHIFIRHKKIKRNFQIIYTSAPNLYGVLGDFDNSVSQCGFTNDKIMVTGNFVLSCKYRCGIFYDLPHPARLLKLYNRGYDILVPGTLTEKVYSLLDIRYADNIRNAKNLENNQKNINFCLDDKKVDYCNYNYYYPKPNEEDYKICYEIRLRRKSATAISKNIDDILKNVVKFKKEDYFFTVNDKSIKHLDNIELHLTSFNQNHTSYRIPYISIVKPVLFKLKDCKITKCNLIYNRIYVVIELTDTVMIDYMSHVLSIIRFKLDEMKHELKKEAHHIRNPVQNANDIKTLLEHKSFNDPKSVAAVIKLSDDENSNDIRLDLPIKMNKIKRGMTPQELQSVLNLNGTRLNCHLVMDKVWMNPTFILKNEIKKLSFKTPDNERQYFGGYP